MKPPAQNLDGEIHRHRRARNFAIGGALLAFVVVIFLITIVKFGGR